MSAGQYQFDFTARPKQAAKPSGFTDRNATMAVRLLYEGEADRTRYRNVVTHLTRQQLHKFAQALASIHRRILKTEDLTNRIARFEKPEAPLDLGHPDEETWLA